jgi:hypothetical protein
MGLYKDIALPLAERGIPTVPLRPRTKNAFLPDWQNIATTDPAVIESWDNQYPNSNAGSVAKGELGRYWFLEVDDPTLPGQIEIETGFEIPKTFRVRSSPGKGHYYWKQSPSSIAMGNITQPYVRNRNFSVRVNNEYVVSPGSWHPTSGRQYEVVSTHDIVEAPEWLIEWIIRQRIDNVSTQKKIDLNINSTERIPRGTHDVTLTAIAGKLRGAGLEENSLADALIEACEKRCDDYGPDYKEMCRKIAHSIAKKPVGEVAEPAFFGSKLNLPPVPVPVSVQPSVQDESEELEEQPKFTVAGHPKFPNWIMNGTSIYNGLVKPYCDVNSRYEEFMFMPAFALLLNYIGTKVNIYMKNVIPSVFMVIIGKRGETMKSASVQDAIQYFNFMGVCEHAGPGTKTAEGKSLVWTAGSPEGLGIDVQRTNCKNIVLAYDELSMLVNKAGIDSSGLVSALLGLYESAKFQNKIKSGKESYSVDPGTYCATLIACCTDKNFLPNWSKLAGDSTGLDDRFFFLFQPETFKKPTPQIAVNVKDGALETRKLIDAAVKQGTFRITDDSPLAHKMANRDIDNREGIRVEKFALGFAVDMGKTEIDEECIERALALVKYEKDVKAYLAPFEASTVEGAIQMELITFLKKGNGVQTMRDINRSMHPERMGSSLWTRSYSGLVQLGYIKHEGKGTKSDPLKVILMRAPEED